MIIGSACPALSFVGIGSVGVTIGSPTVSGTGTSFLTYFMVGDQITINNQTQTIISITSDILMTTTTGWSFNMTTTNYSGTKFLEHSNFNPIVITPDFIEQDSILTGKRNFVNTHQYSDFNFILFLYKYSEPIAKANSLLSVDGSVVNFQPYSDQAALTKEDGSLLNFYLTLSFGYLNNLIKLDIATLTFTSLDRSGLVLNFKGYGTDYGKGQGGGGLYGL